MRFEVAPLPLDVVVCFFLWTGIVPSLWEFVWNVSRNGICLYYYLVYPSLGRLYFTHNLGWHREGPVCHKLGITYRGNVNELPCYKRDDHWGLELEHSKSRHNTPRLLAAYTAARQERFGK